MIKLAPLAQALLVAAAVAAAPVAAFAQTAPTTAPAAPAVSTTQPAKPAVAQPGKAPLQTADAACAVHKKDSKEFKDCMDKVKANTPNKTPSKDPAKKS